MPILGGWGEGKDAVFYQQGRGWVRFPSCLLFCRINSTLRYYLMNHPEKFVQGYSVMTTQYRYTEYVGLTEWVSNKPLHPKTQNSKTRHQCRDRGAAAELGRCAWMGGTLRSRSGSSGIENTLKRERLLSGELQPLPRPRLPGPQGADEEAAARGMVRPQLTFWRTLSLLRASWHSSWSGDCFLEIDIEITCACSSLLYLYSRQIGQKQTTETKSSRIFFKEMNDSNWFLIFSQNLARSW